MKREWPPLLSAGLHRLSATECRQLILQARSGDDVAHCSHLWDQLTHFRGLIAALGGTGRWWIDGSMLTLKPQPSDIDCVWWPDLNCATALVPHGVQLDHWFQHGAARALFKVDAHLDVAWQVDKVQYWQRTFGRARSGQSKGIVELLP